MDDLMRKNITYFLVSFLVAIIFSLNIATTKLAYAGAPRLGSCTDLEHGRQVNTKPKTNLKTYADVVRKESGNKVSFTIRFNPTHYYLSRATQQWLFYRQCGRINEDHESIKYENARITLLEERRADCWAIRYMVNELGLISARNIDRIKRDIDMLERNSDRWRAIFGSRRSRVFTSECLSQKDK